MSAKSGRVGGKPRTFGAALTVTATVGGVLVAIVTTAPPATAQSGLEQSKSIEMAASEKFGPIPAGTVTSLKQNGIDVAGPADYPTAFADIYTGRAAVVEVQANQINNGPVTWTASWMAPNDSGATVDTTFDGVTCDVPAEASSSSAAGSWALDPSTCSGAHLQVNPGAGGLSASSVIYIADEFTRVGNPVGFPHAASFEFHAVKGATVHLPDLTYGALTGTDNPACIARVSGAPDGFTVHQNGALTYTPPDPADGGKLTFSYTLGQSVRLGVSGDERSCDTLYSPVDTKPVTGTVTIYLSGEQPPTVIPIYVVGWGSYGDSSLQNITAFAANPYDVTNVNPTEVSCTQVADAYSDPVSDLSSLHSGVYPIYPDSCSGAVNLTGSNVIFAYSGVYQVAPTTQTLSFTSGSVPTTADDGDTFTPAATSTSGLTPTIAVSGGCTLDPDTGEVTMTSAVGNCVVTATQAGDDDYVAATPVSATVGPVPTLTVQATAAAGTSIPVSGSGWRANDEVAVMLYAPSGTEIDRTMTPIETDSEGEFHTTIAVPADATGTLSVAADGDNGGMASHPSYIDVQPKPTLDVTATPRSGEPIAVGGSGWVAGSTVALTLNDPDGSEVYSGSAVVANDGRIPFGTSLTVPGGAATGLYSVDAAGGGFSSNITVHTAVNGPLPQTLSFASESVPESATFGQGFTPDVTSTGPSDLVPVLSTSGACRVDTATGAVTMTSGTGTCTVSASQPGNAFYAAATAVRATVAATPQEQTLTLAADSLPATVATGGRFTPAATSSVGLLPTITVSGPCTLDSDTGVVTVTGGTGTCTVSASQPGSADYAAASADPATVQATKAAQTISFTPPASGTAGDTATLSAAGGASGNPVTFTVDTANSAPPDACSVSGSTVTFARAGTCVIDADQAGNADYTAAAQVTGTITVVMPDDSGGTGGTGGGDGTITGTVPAGGSVSSSTGSTPSASTPVIATVTSPQGGDVTFTPQGEGAPQTGYTMLGHSFHITAPPATAADPLRLTFSVDDAALPSDADPSALTVFRDGQAIPACADPDATTADPDPCVTASTSTDGVTTVAVLTSHASTWSFGVKSTTTPAIDRVKVAAARAVPVGGSQRIAARVWNTDGSLAADTEVHFTVSGANTTSGTAKTGPKGQLAHFTYIAGHAGTDTVTATVDGHRATTTVTITGPVPWLGAISRSTGTVNIAFDPVRPTRLDPFGDPSAPVVPIGQKVRVYVVQHPRSAHPVLLRAGYVRIDRSGRAHGVLDVFAYRDGSLHHFRPGGAYVLRAGVAGNPYLSDGVRVTVG